MALFIIINNSKLSILKARNYLGIAKIKLGALNFDHPLVRKKHRLPSKKNVRRLRNVFERAGCERLEKENFINAVVDDAALISSLAFSGLNKQRFRQLQEGDSIPFVDLRSVDCLGGLHRIEAAKEFLDDNDQWWIVRLFSKGEPVYLSVSLLQLRIYCRSPTNSPYEDDRRILE